MHHIRIIIIYLVIVAEQAGLSIALPESQCDGSLSTHNICLPLYLIEMPFYTFANRADPDQEAVRAA